MKCDDCYLGVTNDYEPDYIYEHNIHLFSKKELDGRRGYSTLFNFCPFCGNEINWKKIKNNAKSKNNM